MRGGAVVAITRAVSPTLGSCELTHLAREHIDLSRAVAQHAAYEDTLTSLGCRVERLSADETIPDSVFVEDMAIVLDEVAIVTRPGAVSRRAEVHAVADALTRYRTLAEIEPPATLDGGDVIVIGRRLFVGVTSRTNHHALEQMQGILSPHGYDVQPVEVHGCLHLKSAATALGDRSVLLNPAWVSPDVFRGYALVEVAREEPRAANVVAVNGALISAAAFPHTCDALEARGFTVRRVDVSEIAKAEGAVTCCSLLVRLED